MIVNKVQTEDNRQSQDNSMTKKKTIGNRKYLSLISDVFLNSKDEAKKSKNREADEVE